MKNINKFKINTNPTNQDLNMFDLNLISEEIINLNIPSTPEIINRKKNSQKSKINGQFGGAEDDEYRIIRETSRKNLKFNCSETVLDLQVKDKEYANFTEAVDSCQRFINQIHHKYIEPTYQNNFIRLAIVNQDFAPINIGFTKASSVTPKLFFDHIDQVVQSRKKSMETEKTSMYNLKFSIFIANVIRGGSKSAKK